MRVPSRQNKRRAKAKPVPKRVIQAQSLRNLLARTAKNLECVYIQEPELHFGGKQLCVDPKTGLMAFGPYSRTDATRREQVRIGIVGPAEAVDRAIGLLDSLTRPIEQTAKVDAILHPGFPGINSGDPFQVELVTQNVCIERCVP